MRKRCCVKIDEITRRMREGCWMSTDKMKTRKCEVNKDKERGEGETLG